MIPAFSRSYNDVVAEVLMTRAAFAGAVLLVEGSTDSRFITRYIHKDCTQVIIGGGKGILIKAIDALQRLRIVGVVAVVDRDYDHHVGLQLAGPICVTDTHDIETLLLSKRLNTVLAELSNPQKVKNFEVLNSATVEAALISKAACFSRLRFLNEIRPALALSFSSFSPWKYIDQKTWAVDELQLLNDFASAANRSTSDLRGLQDDIPDLASWLDIHGHDALNILSIGIRRVLGDAKQVSESSLSSCLRLAFTEEDFRKTELHNQLLKWENSSEGLPLLIH